MLDRHPVHTIFQTFPTAENEKVILKTDINVHHFNVDFIQKDPKVYHLRKYKVLNLYEGVERN